jgi:hypothetical protein
MKPSEFFELFSALHGTSPRPQPWQMEMVDRLWARRLETGKPILMTSNWSPRQNDWYFQQWCEHEKSVFRSFFVGADYGAEPDKSSLVVIKNRSVGCSWEPRPKPTIIVCDEIAYLPVRHPSAQALRDLEVIHSLAWGRQSGNTALQTEATRFHQEHQCEPWAIADCTMEPPAPKKKAREPFYAKFQPKRRLA